MSASKPIVIDLFSGCGGFSLGAARAGFSVVGAADNDVHAIKAHKCNFPNSNHIDKDLSDIGGAEIRGELGLGDIEIDGIIGGPPCQGFSTIGHRNGEDPRNLLFGRFFELVAELKPDFFLSENVPGICHPSFDAIRETALENVRGDYVTLPPMKLLASDYGAPTSRQRVFFFGYRKDINWAISSDSFLPLEDVEQVNVSDALKGLRRKISDDWQEESQGWRKVDSGHNGAFGRRVRGKVPLGVGDSNAKRRLKKENRVSGCLGTKHTAAVVRRFRKVQPGKCDKVSRAGRLDPQGFCPTIRAGTGSDRGSYQAVRPIHPTEDRVITPREAARLQGFPDWFQFDATKWHSFRQIGNSVSPILAEYVLGVIKDAIKRTRG